MVHKPPDRQSSTAPVNNPRITDPAIVEQILILMLNKSEIRKRFPNLDQTYESRKVHFAERVTTLRELLEIRAARWWNFILERVHYGGVGILNNNCIPWTFSIARFCKTHSHQTLPRRNRIVQFTWLTLGRLTTQIYTLLLSSNPIGWLNSHLQAIY